jgi:hypothetical protein
MESKKEGGKIMACTYKNHHLEWYLGNPPKMDGHSYYSDKEL